MKHWANASQHITDFDLSPDGKRAVFAARGEVFTVPAKEGSIRNLTHSPGVREQKVAWSPNGQWIAYISDRTGEDEIYITPQDGLGKREQITSGTQGFMFQPTWSPDSTKIAWADKDLQALVRRHQRQEAGRGRPRQVLSKSTTTPGRPTASGWPTTSNEIRTSRSSISTDSPTAKLRR